MIKIMVFGTFDILHLGHLDFFRQAKEHGDQLTVVVAHDETVKTIKGEYPIHKQTERMAEIEKQGIVDEVIAAQSGGDKLQIIRERQPAIICLGYDQRKFVGELERYIKGSNQNIKIIRARSYKPEIYKSSKLIKKIKI
ncbi:adenylyltransferase/cytidyltransferase family protein [Patescibacteria group bacterium]|nr:adenylyltransferase/cytidyltransferase family protein [Patescibacteria group bacterium]